MLRLVIQFLAIIVILIAGGLAYVHINAGETVVVSSPNVTIAATPLAGSAPPAATATPTLLPRSAAGPEPGWGQTTIYLGSYHLTASSNTTLAAQSRLTISRRSSTELSGVLTLPPANQAGGSFLADLYLTDFRHNGMVRRATINLGSAGGPPVGSVVVRSFTGTTLVVVITLQGEPPLTLGFTHNGATPHG
jgi:hypothetical protein